MKVASVGLGWWSDVLADAIKRSGKLEIVTCFSRSEAGVCKEVSVRHGAIV
jgi:predicted dehydrogenase